jgi:hypothetical protein
MRMCIRGEEHVPEGKMQQTWFCNVLQSKCGKLGQQNAREAKTKESE